MTSGRLHGNQRAMHEAHHVADGVKRAHFFLDGSLFIVEKFDFVWQVQIVVDRILITFELIHELLVVRLTLGDIFDEIGHFLLVFVTPRVSAPPVIVETVLYLFHLFDDCLLCEMLEVCVNGSINLQSVGVEVVTVFLAPIAQLVRNSLAEVKCLTIVIRLYTIVELDGLQLECIVGLLCQVSVFAHIVKHHVTAFK